MRGGQVWMIGGIGTAMDEGLKREVNRELREPGRRTGWQRISVC